MSWNSRGLTPIILNFISLRIYYDIDSLVFSPLVIRVNVMVLCSDLNYLIGYHQKGVNYQFAVKNRLNVCKEQQNSAFFSDLFIAAGPTTKAIWAINIDLVRAQYKVTSTSVSIRNCQNTVLFVKGVSRTGCLALFRLSQNIFKVSLGFSSNIY